MFLSKLHLVIQIEIQPKIFPKIPLGKFKSFFLITLLLSEREKGKEDIFTLCLQMVKYRFSFFNKNLLSCTTWWCLSWKWLVIILWSTKTIQQIIGREESRLQLRKQTVLRIKIRERGREVENIYRADIEKCGIWFCYYSARLKCIIY